MSKNLFTNPYVLMVAIDDEGGETFPGSAQSGLLPFPTDFANWQNSARGNNALDFDSDGDWDEYDYSQWWLKLAAEKPDLFTQAAWESLNPGKPYPAP